MFAHAAQAIAFLVQVEILFLFACFGVGRNKNYGYEQGTDETLHLNSLK
jgi:hypothetical protein